MNEHRVANTKATTAGGNATGGDWRLAPPSPSGGDVAATGPGSTGGHALRRNVKDSVFCSMFSEKRYVADLYRGLYPGEPEADEDDLEIITIDRVVSAGEHNDLGFVIHGRLVVLVEAQSTWSPNIATRMLLYAAETYRRVVASSRRAFYGSKAVRLPRPNLFVIYTGEGEVPADAVLSRDIFEPGGESSIDATVKVLTGGPGIVGEYVEFSRKATEISAMDAPSEDKARMLLDWCTASGILASYMDGHYEEVRGIMFNLFDQAEVTRQREAEIAEESRAEGEAKGRAEGLAEGEAKTYLALLRSFVGEKGMTVDEAMSLLSIPDDRRAEYERLLAEAGD